MTAPPAASPLFAGIDWASKTHMICVVDQLGDIRARFEIVNTGKTFTGLVRRLTKLGVAGVAIERCDGPFVEALLDADLPVFVITPRQVKGLRSRYSGSGAKSDASDAYLLGDVLRTDRHRLTPLRQDSPATQVLRALSRTRKQLVESRVGLVNQLHAELERSFPGAIGLFARLDSDVAIAFLRRYPTQQATTKLTRARFAAFLRRISYSGRQPIDQLYRRLTDAPAAGLTAEEAEGHAVCVSALLRAIETTRREERELQAEIVERLDRLTAVAGPGSASDRAAPVPSNPRRNAMAAIPSTRAVSTSGTRLHQVSTANGTVPASSSTRRSTDRRTHGAAISARPPTPPTTSSTGSSAPAAIRHIRHPHALIRTESQCSASAAGSSRTPAPAIVRVAAPRSSGPGNHHNAPTVLKHTAPTTSRPVAQPRRPPLLRVGRRSSRAHPAATPLSITVSAPRPPGFALFPDHSGICAPARIWTIPAATPRTAPARPSRAAQRISPSTGSRRVVGPVRLTWSPPTSRGAGCAAPHAEGARSGR